MALSDPGETHDQMNFSEFHGVSVRCRIGAALIHTGNLGYPAERVFSKMAIISSRTSKVLRKGKSFPKVKCGEDG